MAGNHTRAHIARLTRHSGGGVPAHAGDVVWRKQHALVRDLYGVYGRIFAIDTHGHALKALELTRRGLILVLLLARIIHEGIGLRPGFLRGALAGYRLRRRTSLILIIARQVQHYLQQDQCHHNDGRDNSDQLATAHALLADAPFFPTRRMLRHSIVFRLLWLRVLSHS